MNLTFTAHVACKNPVQKGLKIKFVELDFKYQEQINRGYDILKQNWMFYKFASWIIGCILFHDICLCLRMICKKQEFAAFCKLKLCMTNLDINNSEVQWRLVHFNFKQLVQHVKFSGAVCLERCLPSVCITKYENWIWAYRNWK